MSSPEGLAARIVNVVPQPVWVVDHLGRIMFANPAACGVLGYAGPEQLRGRPSHETVHYKRPDGTPYPQDECPMLRPQRTGAPAHGENEWFVRRDGSMFPIAWWSAPLDMPEGRGAVLAFTDLTERLASEAAIRERDAAEIRARESRAAQRRMLESATTARHQLARDLHDGAQQRLVTLLLALRLARKQAPGGSETEALLEDAIGEASAALDELRELAAGIHPPVLTSHGLPAALGALARRCPLTVTVSASVPGRLPEAVEANAYFLTAEALTNAVKHARASRVEVTADCDGRTLTLQIRDDGVGGASTRAGGNGLSGMADRATALGGQLTVSSPELAGTCVRAVIPVDVPASRLSDSQAR